MKDVVSRSGGRLRLHCRLRLRGWLLWRLLRAEEKAARLPATLTVPMIVFILPVLFIVLIGPAIISVMDNLLS